MKILYIKKCYAQTQNQRQTEKYSRSLYYYYIIVDKDNDQFTKLLNRQTELAQLIIVFIRLLAKLDSLTNELISTLVLFIIAES